MSPADPSLVSRHRQQGETARAAGDLVAATGRYLSALALQPDSVEILSKLAALFAARGQIEPAIRICERILSLKPSDVNALLQMCALLWQSGKLEAAAEALGRAVRLWPGNAEAHAKLALVLGNLGRGEDSIAVWQKAVELEPRSAAIHSGLLAAMHCSEQFDAQAMFAEHLRWASRHGQPGPAGNLTAAPKQQNGRLRVGYVSPDFREHPTARLMGPLLDQHDREKFQIFCFSDVQQPDATTAALQAACEEWRDVSKLSIPAVAELVQKDGIDILVDLAGHCSNRLLQLFAERVAPVQVTYFGYLNTTGLRTMDWRITDEWFDPPGKTEAFHTERLMRLPGSAWVYRPLLAKPEIGPPPCVKNGYVTYGCFNRFAKISPRVMRLWGKILDAMPTSRLILCSGTPGPAEPSMIQLLASHGINPARVDWTARKPPMDYLQQYQSIDIALDTHPQNGGVTTLDSMWMGVPVVSRYGADCRSRLGLGILSNVGLGDFSVSTDEEYVDRAVSLAGDRKRLSELRIALPARLGCSTLMDEVGIARKLEGAYLQMGYARG